MCFLCILRHVVCITVLQFNLYVRRISDIVNYAVPCCLSFVLRGLLCLLSNVAMLLLCTMRRVVYGKLYSFYSFNGQA